MLVLMETQKIKDGRSLSHELLEGFRMAAVNQKGRLCFDLTRDGERFTSKTFLRFIRKLRLEAPLRTKPHL